MVKKGFGHEYNMIDEKPIQINNEAKEVSLRNIAFEKVVFNDCYNLQNVRKMDVALKIFSSLVKRIGKPITVKKLRYEMDQSFSDFSLDELFNWAPMAFSEVFRVFEVEFLLKTHTLSLAIKKINFDEIIGLPNSVVLTTREEYYLQKDLAKIEREFLRFLQKHRNESRRFSLHLHIPKSLENSSDLEDYSEVILSTYLYKFLHEHF